MRPLIPNSISLTSSCSERGSLFLWLPPCQGNGWFSGMVSTLWFCRLRQNCHSIWGSCTTNIVRFRRMVLKAYNVPWTQNKQIVHHFLCYCKGFKDISILRVIFEEILVLHLIVWDGKRSIIFFLQISSFFLLNCSYCNKIIMKWLNKIYIIKSLWN